MNKELYVFKCKDCNMTFRTDNPKQKLCPTCQELRSPHNRPKKQPKKILTFADISHITNVYYKIHHKYLHYGEMVHLIDSNPKKCVCCGAKVYKGKHLCAKCEKVGG